MTQPLDVSSKSEIKADFWCERVRLCFQSFVKNPHSLQHLLLFGPPGSGKTTSASWLVRQIWGSKYPLMCMSMNAADERSLESIRQKVYPFLHADWRQEDASKAPRFLILDECETLTEAAQLSLQTILNISASDICVILICNSQSRIHPKLRKRLLRIRYDPPSRTPYTSCFDEITRGDLRFSNKQNEIESRINYYIHSHNENIPNILLNKTVDFTTILTEILLLANHFEILDKELMDCINITYPFLTDSIYSNSIVESYIVKTINIFRQKFEQSYNC
jgi:DNA polymerase III delta prime subunit